MKASEVGDWLRQMTGKRDHREVLRDDYVVRFAGPLAGPTHGLGPVWVATPSL